MTTVQVRKMHTLSGHNDCVYTLERSAENNLVFSGAGDGMVAVWDLNTPETGHLVARLPNSVYSLHYHHATTLLVAGHNYEGIHLLDWKNKKETGSLQLTKAAIFDLKSAGGKLYAGCGDGTVYRVNVETLTVEAKVTASEKSARTIAVHPGLEEIAVGYSDNYIRIFDYNLRLIREWQGHVNSVFTLAYGPGGNLLFSGGRDARLKVWNTADGYTMGAEIVAHMYAINSLDFSPDKKHFVTCSLDKTIKVWDTVELKLLKVIDRARHEGHRTSVNKVLWTDHNEQLLSASDDRTISVWHLIF